MRIISHPSSRVAATLTVALTLTLPLAAPAQANDDAPAGNYIGIGLGANWLHDTSVRRGGAPFSFHQTAKFHTGYAGMLSLGHLFPSGFRGELELNYRHNDFESLRQGQTDRYAAAGSARSYGLFINGLYDFRTGTAITPYLGIGFGVLQVKYSDAAPFGRGATRPGVGIDDSDSGLAWQAIAGLRLAVTDNVAVTADYRYYQSLHQPKLDASDGPKNVSLDWAGNTLMLGVEIGFGGAGSTSAPAPEPTPVQSAPSESTPPADSDYDGVNDNLDRCPGTAYGVAVDDAGCPLDPDSDGVLKSQDQCPGTPAGATVNYQGCRVLETRRLNSLHFAFDSAALTDKDTRYLDAEEDKINRALSKYPRATVEIAGYTDSIGTDEYNLDLSQQRTDSVRDYLVAHGVDPNRITAHGYGESDPAADNSTAAGRARNRRVEVRLIGHG